MCALRNLFAWLCSTLVSCPLICALSTSFSCLIPHGSSSDIPLCTRCSRSFLWLFLVLQRKSLVSLHHVRFSTIKNSRLALNCFAWVHQGLRLLCFLPIRKRSLVIWMVIPCGIICIASGMIMWVSGPFLFPTPFFLLYFLSVLFYLSGSLRYRTHPAPWGRWSGRSGRHLMRKEGCISFPVECPTNAYVSPCLCSFFFVRRRS